MSDYNKPTWGANLHNLPTSRLESMLTQYSRQLWHKYDVARKHKPGTPYHTRAMREAGMYQERCAKIRAILDGR